MSSPPLPPVSRTPSYSESTVRYPSSPVKEVAKHFAEHKRDEVQAFGYNENIHMLEGFKTQEQFLNFLGVPGEFLETQPPTVESVAANVEPNPSNVKSSRRNVKGRILPDVKPNGGKQTNDSKFSLQNFVSAANSLAKFMKETREFFLSLLFLPMHDLNFRFSERAPLGVQVDRKQSPARTRHGH